MELLGVELGHKLNFKEQVSRICQKIARQLNHGAPKDQQIFV